MNRHHHLAYLCFAPAILISLISGITRMMQIDTGTAGGIGFLLLIPLALLALFSIPVGIVLAIQHRKDPVLMTLVVLTVLYLVEIITEAGDAKFYNTVLFLYGIVGLVLLGWWFLLGRKTYR